MDTRIALSGQPLDIYGALMRGYKSAMIRQQDQQQQEDRAAYLGALSRRYANDPTAGALARTPEGQKMLEMEQDQEKLDLERRKYLSQQYSDAGPVILKMTQALKGVPREQRGIVKQQMGEVLSKMSPEVANDFMSLIDDYSDEGLASLEASYSGFGPDKPEDPSVLRVADSLYTRGSPEWRAFVEESELNQGVQVNLPGAKIRDALPPPKEGYTYRTDLNTGDVALNAEGLPELLPIPGAPVSAEESKTSYVAQLLTGFEDNLRDILSTYPEFDPASMWNIPGSYANWLASPAQQQYRSAADEWTANTIFLRSGAAVTKDEKTAAFKNYFPQPGDDPATMKRKQIMRNMQTEKIIGKAGRAYKDEANKKVYYTTREDGTQKTMTWADIVETAETYEMSPSEVMEVLRIKSK